MSACSIRRRTVWSYARLPIATKPAFPWALPAWTPAYSTQSIAHYNAPGAAAPEMRIAWAQNRLYFTDPLYDTNYLFAGLLALEYFRRFEADPANFSKRYVALLKSGSSETPQALEKRLLGLDMDDARALTGDASSLIEARSRTLAGLYEAQTRRP